MNVKRLVLALQVATAVLSMTYGVMFTMLDDYRDEYGISESGLGLVLAVGFFAAFVGQITLAPLADRGHAKRMMIMGFALVVVGCLLMAFGTTLSALLTGRLVTGVGAGMSLPALRKIVIVSDPENLGATWDACSESMSPVLHSVPCCPRCSSARSAWRHPSSSSAVR